MFKSNKYTINYRAVYALVLMVFLNSITYVLCFGYITYHTKKESDLLEKVELKESELIANENSKANEKVLKLKELQKENSDIVAYIEIEGTSISYPVLQTDNNDYYLNHNYKKKKSSTGSIYLDKDSDLEKPTSNFLIYGHRSKNGLMFEDLVKYKKKSFYKKHPTIEFTTENEHSEYEIIAVFLSRIYYQKEKNVFRYYYFIDAKDEKEFNSYVKNSKKASLYDTGKTAKYGDQLLTLSTCEYSQEDGRLAIVARKVTK